MRNRDGYELKAMNYALWIGLCLDGGLDMRGRNLFGGKIWRCVLVCISFCT